MEHRKANAILDIRCASCGAPAAFDIAKQRYLCAYCGAETGVREALEEKKRFRALHRARLEAAPRAKMFSAHCNGCGAEIVFSEGEALTKCAFCGKSLVRKEYLKTDEFPELLIPFRLTPAQAREKLLDWCRHNAGRREARALKARADELEGFYLPYQLIKGPTSCKVRRENTHRTYECRGFLDGMFVNTSKNLNNLVLNGAEPYDLSELREFEFSYLAGQRVRMADLTGSDEAARVQAEITAEYEPFLHRTMETKAVEATPDTGGLLSMSVVLPAYYLRAGDVLAAVNGQTGKVAVQERKNRFLLPWWIRPILLTLLLAGLTFGITYLIAKELIAAYFLTGTLGVFFAAVVFTAYHNDYAGSTRWKLRKRILTSDDTRVALPPPCFYETVDGKALPVRLRFTTPLRTLRQVTLTLVVVFLPVLLAFLCNGLSFEGLTIGGAAVWLCIFVPLAPVYLIKFGRMELYEFPLIYTERKPGKWRRLRKKLAPKKLLEQFLKLVRMPGLWIALGVAGLILAICTELVLHWDNYG